MNKEYINEKIKIESLDLEDNKFKITNKEEKYYLEINNGSVDVIVKNNEGDEVGFKYLEIGDKIKIKGYKNKENKIIIKKIYINTKYLFNSESSDDLELY